MLLSIDRVLQLLSEGKSIKKIAEFANCTETDVISVITTARKIINNQDKQLSKKKIIIKKTPGGVETEEEKQKTADIKKIFKGSELSAVPMESSLIMYTGGASIGNPGPAGIGIIIHDKEDRQVGKVTAHIGKRVELEAKYHAIFRALQIAIYFQTKELKIRSDSELIIRQINGEQKIEKISIKKLYNEIIQLKKGIKQCRFEHVTRNLNEKADYLSKLAAHKKNFS